MKKLEEILDIQPTPALGELPSDEQSQQQTISIDQLPDNLPDLSDLSAMEQLSDTTPLAELDQFDKINASLPVVTGLGQMADKELDNLADKAEKAYDDLMDLGMNVDARYGARMFEVAAAMMNAAINAKSTKLDKKLKMIDLQLKKLAIDKKPTPADKNQPVESKGFIVTDRNSILEQLKNPTPKK